MKREAIIPAVVSAEASRVGGRTGKGGKAAARQKRKRKMNSRTHSYL